MALELALKAKLGEPDAPMLPRVVIAVSEAFDLDDPMRHAAKQFADRFPLARRNPPMLRDAGDDLFRAVKRASWPDLAARLDIEG